MGEPFRVAAMLGALRPSVAVRMKGNAFDSESFAALLEFRGAVTIPFLECLTATWKSCGIAIGQIEWDSYKQSYMYRVADILSILIK